MTIVDSSVWVDYLRGTPTPETDWLDARLLQHLVGTTDLILCEVLQGIRDEAQFTKTRDKLFTLSSFANGGRELTLAAVANYRTLRARGYTVKTVDCLIATFCIVNGHTILHNDRDYDVFEKELALVVIHPEA